MDTGKAIQIAIAKADLIFCSVTRWLAVAGIAVIFLLAILFILLVLRPDPEAKELEAEEPLCAIGGEPDADTDAHP